MRILICTNSLGAKGGLERVTIVKANALAEIDGNEVAVCYTDRGTYPHDTIHPLSPKVRVFDAGVTFWDLYPLNLKNLLITAPRKFLALRRSLKRLIRGFAPDVVVSTGSYEKFALASIRLPRPAVKVREYHFSSRYRIFDALYGGPASESGRKGRVGIGPRLAGFVDNRIVSRFYHCSYLLTREDAANFKGISRFDYQYNPCSFSAEAPADVSRENIVAVVGRLVDVKNVEAILRIWAQVQATGRCASWQLWIVGDGHLRKQLEAMSVSLGISDTVRFLGFRTDVMDILQRSRIMAMASKYEGMPLNLLEAMHCGAVPVSYRTPYGPSDIVTDGVDGVLVDYLDEDAYARRLAELMLSPSDIERMSAAARTRSADFAPAVIAAQWMQKYSALRAARLS